MYGKARWDKYTSIKSFFTNCNEQVKIVAIGKFERNSKCLHVLFILKR